MPCKSYTILYKGLVHWEILVSEVGSWHPSLVDIEAQLDWNARRELVISKRHIEPSGEAK